MVSRSKSSSGRSASGESKQMTDTVESDQAYEPKFVKVSCPFVYAKGKRCTGHIVGIEAFKADIGWSFRDGVWSFSVDRPRSHYHLYCSEKGNHAGYGRADSDQMKFFYNKLP